jgi:aspartyl-tRNA(Asn)/glutamyl-tRNA(Gln) amidotransferase subunit A
MRTRAQEAAVTHDLPYLTATELLAAYRATELSPVEATEVALARIEELDPTVNAFCMVDTERALADARAAQERWGRGRPVGALDGVPVAVKDVFLTAGWPTMKGSRTTDLAGPWDDDAPAVAALRRHGAILHGKTTTPELGWKGVTDSPLTGVTRNPWDPSRTAGGSSGGSAAAVSLGMTPLALGTDGGGSIRIPCGFCGLAGIKPTYGRVPLWPVSPFGTLAHAGPMSRTVTDAALLLDVLSEPDSRDWTALPPPTGSFTVALDGGVAGLRIAFSPDLGYVRVDDEIAAVVAMAAQALAELGATVERCDPPFDDPREDFETLWYAGAASATTGLDEALLDPGLAEIVALGRRQTAMTYLDATRRRGELGVRMGRFHEEWDLLITPSLPLPAFEAGREVPPGWPHPRWQTWTGFTYPFNLTQQPAASVPCGFTRGGLPIGLQIVGARHADALVLRAARAYEAANPLFDRHPPLGSTAPRSDTTRSADR